MNPATVLDHSRVSYYNYDNTDVGAEEELKGQMISKECDVALTALAKEHNTT